MISMTTVPTPMPNWPLRKNAARAFPPEEDEQQQRAVQRVAVKVLKQQQRRLAAVTPGTPRTAQDGGVIANAL